ncbi:hypothetical protein BDW60DRAFT_179787 [Aspergillus nidulans var. acristatus]
MPPTRARRKATRALVAVTANANAYYCVEYAFLNWNDSLPTFQTSSQHGYLSLWFAKSSQLPPRHHQEARKYEFISRCHLPCS